MHEDAPSAKKKVLVTGATGTLGTIVTEDLAGSYDFTMTSRRDIPRRGFRRLDIAEDYEALAEIVAEQDAVVHLAYVEEDESTVTNLKMTKNVYRAALAASGRPRLVMASSIHAVGGLIDWNNEPYASIARRSSGSLAAPPPPIPASHPPCPNGVYGALKGYIEILGQYYASRWLEVVAIRYGGVRADDSFPPEPGYHSFFLSRRDCAEVVRRAIEAELPQKFNLVFAVSRNTWRVHDIESARRILGFEPTDDAEDFVA
ncbi:MAG: NAD-dependent epimerase/dehydratase family protein [Planctomycetota bacterium]|jgi:nucleoside-diphosphate-sugar epimerase